MEMRPVLRDEILIDDFLTALGVMANALARATGCRWRPCTLPQRPEHACMIRKTDDGKSVIVLIASREISADEMRKAS